MNTKFFFLVLAVCGLFVGTACDDDNDDKRYTPDSAITKAFAEKYPDAQRISWETKHGYEVADFYLGNQDTEAWFDNQGNWIFTETEIPLSIVPAAIREDIAAGPYAQWRIKNEVDKVERPDAPTLYILEVEKGEQEMDLYYTENGTLIKEVPDDDNTNSYQPTVVPDAIKNKLAELYPNASFLEYDVEKHGVEVDIFDGNIHKEVVFTPEYEWVYTEWEIHPNDVPAVVMQALRASAYASYAIDDVHVFQKPAGLFYEFELEQGEREIKVTFDAAGTQL